MSCPAKGLSAAGRDNRWLASSLLCFAVLSMVGARIMKTAFAYWDERIAPVFDTARQIHVVEAESGESARETTEALPEELPVQKALRLVALEIDTLVCGAISSPLREWIAAYGIRVIPFVAGNLHEVIRAWRNGELDRDVFAMPGCFGKRRRRGITDTEKEGYEMNGKGRGGAGKGGGQGQCRGGQGRNRTAGPRAAGAVDTCRCPSCGHLEPHERGVPCMQKNCPKCGTAMTRQ